MNERYTPTVCTECGKVFYPEFYSDWGWKDVNGELVCSYKCQRQSEQKEPFKPNPKRKRTAVRIIETGEVFSSICDCAAFLGTSNQNISKCIYRGETYKGLHMERVV